jgi:lysophospholipase L1-like esterase
MGRRLAGAACAVALLTALAIWVIRDDRGSAPRADMVAIGDSYTVALRSGRPCPAAAVCPANSWSTGTTASVNSHLLRIRRIRPTATGSNFAVSGRKMAELNPQAERAVAAGARYVTILGGLNDACRETEAAMTPVGDFRAGFQKTLDTLTSGLPRARVFVASIPDPYRFWEVLRANPAARAVWSADQTCDVMLDKPLSTAPADRARRARARRRTSDLNAQLAAVCATKPNCRFDEGAVFDWDFTAADISTRDYFHLSRRGEARLAAVTYPLAFPPF